MCVCVCVRVGSSVSYFFATMCLLLWLAGLKIKNLMKSICKLLARAEQAKLLNCYTSKKQFLNDSNLHVNTCSTPAPAFPFGELFYHLRLLPQFKTAAFFCPSKIKFARTASNIPPPQHFLVNFLTSLSLSFSLSLFTSLSFSLSIYICLCVCLSDKNLFHLSVVVLGGEGSAEKVAQDSRP